MEVDDIQTPKQASKYTRVNSNAKIDSSNIAKSGAEDGSSGGHGGATVPITTAAANSLLGDGCRDGVGGDTVIGNNNRFGRQWPHSSRIIRVSRASGGKDRHSKVWTAKGARDRRVRLSVTTAIQFYDLQDRLGYDQPSKAVEWLIKAAADAIDELPSLDTANFPPETPRHVCDAPRVGSDVVENAEVGTQKMGGSSSGNDSETSKGSGSGGGLSRDRAKERVVVNVGSSSHLDGVSSVSQTSSFTQLLTGGMTMSNLNETNQGGARSSPSPHSRGGGSGSGGGRGGGNQWLLSSTSSTSSIADYFGTGGLMGLSSSRTGQIQLGNNPSTLPQEMTLTSFGGHDQIQHQQFPFVSSDQHHHNHHMVQVGASGESGSGDDYNLNFKMSPSSNSLTAGYNSRGTLQSNNSPALLPYLQRFSADGSGLPFFLSSAAAVASAPPTVDNHHHHYEDFKPVGLQLCYGDGPSQTYHKGKGKN